MKFILNNLVYISLAIVSGGLLVWTMLKGRGNSVTPAEAVLLMNRNNAAVLDVRDDAEFASGHIPGAIHIPQAQLQDKLASLAKYREKPLVVYCQSGTRSEKAIALLKAQQFAQLHALGGGVDAWLQAKLPLTKD